MQQPWTAYVPRYVVEDVLTYPTESLIGRERRFMAVVMFADISGFTALSETLGQAGKTGTEELTLLLNGYFAPMIELIQSYGGMIGKFSGDALTVLFRFTTETRIATIRRAIACALTMQQQMSRYASMHTSAGICSLEVKIGLALGPVVCTIIGEPALRLEYVIMGKVLSRAAQAQTLADCACVVAHRDVLDPAVRVALAQLLNAADSHSTDTSDGYLAYARIAHLQGDVTHVLRPQFPATLSVTRRGFLEAFHHPSIALRLSKGQRDLINEHRKVTVLFVQFRDFDYDTDPYVCEHLQAYLSDVLWIIGRYDGYLRQVDIGDKGSKYIVMFGAPVTHENDEERALRCALELRQVGDRPTSIGITTGFVYCGLIGSSQRQEYTVVGDTVNLAARLMQLAQPGQILVSTTTHMGAYSQSPYQDTFVWKAIEPVRVKGKSEPVVLSVLKGLRTYSHPYSHTLIDYGPMVGRKAELHTVDMVLKRVLNGQGQIIGITAEAGMGKSRLAAEIIRLANEQKIACLSGVCLSYATTSSYLVWQEVLRGMFDLDPADDIAFQIQQVQIHLAALGPEYVQRAPLLSIALNLPIPDNDLCRTLEGQLRKESLEALILTLLRKQARFTPIVILLEDCHWIDPLSHDLLEIIGRSIIDRPVLIVVVYRPPASAPIRLRITQLAHFHELRLTELSHDEAAQLIELKLTRQLPLTQALARNATSPISMWEGHSAEYDADARIPIAPALIERITERAQGNPLYIDAILSLLHDRGLDLTKMRVFDSLDLPDNLRSLIISRIDQLQEGPKITLKVASVIGQRFHASWLYHIYPQLGTSELVNDHLEYLCRLDLIVLDKPEPEFEYFFKHILTQEVAYTSLSVATREMLHEQIGNLIEACYGESLDTWLDLLVYHYGQSQDGEKKRRYFRQAGVAARLRHANDTAIYYYQQLLPLLSDAEKIDLLLELGDIYQLIGRWNDAEAAYLNAQVYALDLGDRPAHNRCQYAQGSMFYLKGFYREALICFEEVLNECAACDDHVGVVRVLRSFGDVYLQQANYPYALSYYEQCQRMASALGDQREASQAIANMGHIYFHQGDYTRTLDCYEQWLYLAIDLGDQQQAGYMLGRMGHVYARLGNMQSALFCYAQQIRIATEIGDLRMVSMACAYMAEAYGSYLGDLERALACLIRRLEIAVALGDNLGILVGMGYMAIIYSQQYHYTLADWFFQRAIQLGRALKTPHYVCEFLVAQAQMYWHQHGYHDAWAINAEALTMAINVKHKEGQLQATILSLHLSIALHQTDSTTAISTLEQMLHQWSDPLHQALLHYTIWHLDPSRESHRKAAMTIYRHINPQTMRIEHRAYYQELSGERLPDIEDPPELPDVVIRNPVNLALLLSQVDSIIDCL